ncbi:CRISPR-associated protein, Cas2 family [Candidatus Methanoperedens nitroreducens]|uniref:CRISPR-associated endoribonuclease Cas2 n=1 Tax=Candidatus Methanoperedens nitratireducens TaxID=1392998 RepID=A0A062V2S8_9EURY|nr:CRISPR-associated endonuclease Cas2 [Candidatus Methanoperedens nitroreducens]KCZ73386.1 CRISPR-associated protein, Cas2 family [Candidatus Methanoperedens nitroreducens]MDJ1422663.1 CRISPR-associated endonuclease Cas2 [Candidatus Methanoperedens sp.]
MPSKFVLIAYDITDNSLRNRLVDVLFYFNLQRVQYSVFLGYISETHLNHMVEQIYDDFEHEDVKILIVEICKGCFKNIRSINYDIPKEERKHLVV